MGLDSVDLLLAVEKYFSIRIPDAEAEKCITVQHLVDAVARHLNITSDDMELQKIIFSKISDRIRKMTPHGSHIKMADRVSDYLSPVHREDWLTFQRLLGLNVPEPQIINPKSNRLTDRIKKLLNWAPVYDWNAISFEAFTDAICADNYEKLLDAGRLSSKYEIYIAVTAITVDRIGVDYYEISPDKAFVNDLGVN